MGKERGDAVSGAWREGVDGLEVTEEGREVGGHEEIVAGGEKEDNIGTLRISWIQLTERL
jgi:hypothetical protein